MIRPRYLCALVLLAGSSSAAPAARHGHAGHVYTQTNDPAGNTVLAFDRSDDGTLSLTASVATNGKGDGTGLGSQGSVVLSADHEWLFAVNAGTNQVSAFHVTEDGLQLSSIAPSGGDRPVSVTERRGLVYVVNAGTNQGISGFVAIHGRLFPLPHSSHALSAKTPVGAAEIAFSPDGETLVVTEKTTSRIDSFALGRDGTPRSAVFAPSAGVTPFGFDFDPSGTLVTSEAGSSAASSYRLGGRNDAARLVTGPVPVEGAAPCWVAIPRDGRFAYVANAGSNTISAFGIRRDGAIALLPGAAASTTTGTATHPTDMAFAARDRFLYVLSDRSGSIGGFRVDDSGALQPIETGADGLPTTVGGLAAY